jgi:hypothetical protein
VVGRSCGELFDWDNGYREMTYRHIHGCKLAIGLTGAARHGKDSAAIALLRAIPGAERFALSDFVATDCRVHHGMVKRNPALMQTVGTARRESRPTVWLDALYGLLCDREPETIIVTGLRYREEVDLVRCLAPQSIVLRVTRTLPSGQLYVADDRDPNHPVEQGIAALPADAEIVAQSGDVKGLSRQVVQWMQTHVA